MCSLWFSKFASMNYPFDGNKRASAVELMRENLEKVSIIESFNSTKQTSIILEAVENKNKKVIEYLLSNWSHLIELPFEHQLDISTTAFDKNQIDVLYDLINVSDYPFPTNFNIKSFKDGRFKRIANKRDQFHKAISKDDIKAIERFNKENPNLKCAFNTNNKTALCQAIDSNKQDAYIKLKSLRFCKAEHEEDRKPNFDKKKLVFATRSNIKNSNKNEEKCILVLLAKSSIHNVKDDKKVCYHAKIRKWFEDISKVKYGQLLLKVVSSCEKLRIVFDFEEKYIKSIDMTEDDDSMTLGSTHPRFKWILIGAKNSIEKNRDQIICSTLAHELCHYAMLLIYENIANPFYKKSSMIQKFNEIVKECLYQSFKRRKQNNINEPDDECNGIISKVYTNYEEKSFAKELIVRVMEILVFYDGNKEKLTYLEGKKYKSLFDYFENHVKPEMEKFNLNQRQDVRSLNKDIGQLKDIMSLNCEISTNKGIDDLMKNSIIFVCTNHPKLFLRDALNRLHPHNPALLDTNVIIVNAEFISNRANLSKYEDILSEHSNLNIFIDCSKGFNNNLISSNKSHKFIFFGTNASQVNVLQSSSVNNINFHWNDLTAKSQEHLLQTKINFQNNPQVSLLDLITKNVSSNESSSSTAVNQPKDNIKDFSEIIDNQLLNLLIEKKQIEVNKVKENSSDFQFIYQPRWFISSYYSIYSEDQLFSKIKNEKYVLISDIAGNGKSWAMKNISKTLMHQNSTSWVTYVDLKQFMKEFKSQNDKKLEFSTFLIEKILKFKTDKFEAKIFQKMYEIGKVFIIFDGFDEIALDYAEFVSKLTELFEQNGENQLWIATRNHFRINLQKILQIKEAYKLNEFSTENGVELIAKYWMLNEPEIKEITSKDKFDKHLEESTKYKEFLEMAQKLIEKVSMSENRSIGMPQIYTIIAKISKDNKEVTLSFSQTKIYEVLVDILYERWSTQKGEIRNQANKDRQKDGLTFYKFHQYLAIGSLFFEYVEVFFPGYNGSEWPTEEINAGGIVIINYGQINFLHETFREYFVADFIAKELKKEKPHPEVLNMFAEVMTTEEFRVIRMFLNDSLEKQILQKIEPEIQTHKCMKMFQDMDSFADIFNRNLFNLIEFIKEVLKTRKFSRVLFNCACEVLANPSQFLKLQEFLFTHCNVEFLGKLITEKNIFLDLIESRLGIEHFVEFVTKMEAKVGREIVKEGLKQKIKEQGNIFYFLCKSSNFSLEKFQLFLHSITKFLTNEEIFNLMLDCDEYQATILQVIFEYSNIRKPLEIWKEIKKWCNDQNQENLFKKLVSKDDSRRSNILHYSINLNLDQYKQFLEQMFELKILKEMITKVNSNGDSFMHEPMRHNEEDKIEHTLMFLELKFGAVELGEFLKVKNNQNQTVLEVAVKKQKDNFKIYKTLWQLLRQACRTDKEFLEIISDTSQDSRNILQAVAEYDSANEVLEFMIEELDKFDACDEIRRLLSNHAQHCPILLTILANKEEHFELYKKLCKIYHKHFDLSEFLKIAKYQDPDGYKSSLSFLSKVIYHKNKEFVEYTWNEINSLRNQDELQIAHYLRTEHWKNDLLKLSSKNCPEVHNCVQNILKEYKIDFEIQIVPEFSKKFKICIKLKSHDQLEELLTEYEKIFEREGLLEYFKYFLMMPDSESRSFVLQTTLCDNVEIHKVLWKRILNISDCNELKSLQIQNLFFDEILQMFTNTDRYGISILHLAVAYSTVEVFKFLIEILEALASKDEIKDILKSWQKYWNLLYKAAEFNESPELHVELWNFLEKYFNPQEIIEFLKNNDYYYDYDDPLSAALTNNTKEIVELTWNKYKSLSDRDEQVEYLSRNIDELFDLSQENNINMTEVHEWFQRIIIRYPEIIKGLKIKENDFVKESLMSMDQNGNIFYYLCKSATSEDFSVEEYLKTLQKYLKTEEIVNLMKNCYRNGENIFHVCVRAGNGRELVKWLKGVWNFTQSNNLLNELNELLFLTNPNNHNFLDLSVDNNSLEFHQFIWDFLKDLLTNNEILNICVRKNEDNFVHFLLQNNGNPQIVEHIFNIFKSKLTEAEFVEVLNSRGHQGTNLLQAAVMNTKNIEILKIVWNFLLDFYKTDFPQILTAVDNVGRNIISVAACHSSGNHFNLLIDYLKSKLSIIEIKEMLFCFSTKQSSLHYAVCNNKDLTLHEALWTHVSQHFSISEINEIIKCVDLDGDNLLHCAVRWNTKEIVELTWNQIKNYLEPNEQVEYLNATGYEGKNLYEMSLDNEEHPDVQEWVQNIMQTLTPTSSISKLIK